MNVLVGMWLAKFTAKNRNTGVWWVKQTGISFFFFSPLHKKKSGDNVVAGIDSAAAK